MTKKYPEEFKKQIVIEYLKGSSYPKLSAEYGVAKSTILEWVRKYSEECQYTKPEVTKECSAKEIRELQKRIAELEKENLFLKKAAAFFAKEID